MVRFEVNDYEGIQLGSGSAAAAVPRGELRAIEIRLGGGDYVAGVDARADVGRRERDGLAAMVLGDQGHALDGEAEPLAGLAQGFDVAGGFLAEGEVLADQHLDDVQALDEQLVDVAVRGQLHEVGGERHHQQRSGC